MTPEQLLERIDGDGFKAAASMSNAEFDWLLAMAREALAWREECWTPTDANRRKIVDARDASDAAFAAIGGEGGEP